MTVIGLTGLKQRGKSSVADILVREHGFQQFAFADGVRALAVAIDPHIVTQTGRMARYTELLRDKGYEAAKHEPDVRRLLQRIGTEAGRQVFGEGVWVNALAALVQQLPDAAKVVISDVRFPNEAEFVALLGGELWRVQRTLDQAEDLHESERHIAGLPADKELRNHGTLDQLAELVDVALQTELGDDLTRPVLFQLGGYGVMTPVVPNEVVR